MKILISAYACSPGMGSEPGMAWNWCWHLAKHCELFIITEGEFRERIESVLPTIPWGHRMHFYYNPVTERIRRMCWNQGDWRFYKYYKEWQWKTYMMAKELCAEQSIDVLHQLNMIGFREPGYLWKLSKETGIPFVWGPVGGLKQFPKSYARGEGVKMHLFIRLKNLLNKWQLKYDCRVDAALHQASLLLSSIPDSHDALLRYKGVESKIIPETGCYLEEDCGGKRNYQDPYMTLIWVGKFDFRKRLDIALAAIAMASNPYVVLQVYGTGSNKQIQEIKQYCRKLGVEDWVQIKWMGNRPNQEVQKAMCKAHLFLFTSVSEDTSTVVMEAISHHVPILCFDTCGMGYVVNEKVGIKIPLTNPMQSARDFAEKIEYLYTHRDVLAQMSENCRERQRELSWERKAETMVDVYKKVIDGTTEK